MIECGKVEERMPDVARGRGSWSPEELSHLAACRDCAAEWRLVQAGATLHQGLVVDAQRASDGVLARLRAEAPRPSLIRRLPWRSGLIGLLAAAASIAIIIIGTPRHSPAAPGLADSAEALAILPELQGLDDSQLAAVLRSLGPVAGDAAPGLVPHLEDLTDAELEQMIQSRGNE